MSYMPGNTVNYIFTLSHYSIDPPLSLQNSVYEFDYEDLFNFP